ncbi:unnamed protein product [Xylocopa violacea]|uniref:Uncharacterized protein n=1 Tax=Xylocopa violacea TaxID=135666 RepID=A0ABP1N2J9_XYLVO
MESISRAGRNVGSGVYRVAGAFARGARRVLSYVPLLGVAATPPEAEDKPSVGGEETENGSATAGSPVEEKSAVSSPTAENEAAPVAAAAATTAAAAATETKEDSPASAASSPTEEKTEEPTPSAPTPVPVEEKKEEVEKVEAEKKVVEVSPAGGQLVPDPVEVSVFRVQTVATPSIIERKTSEDIPSMPPSSPPPTPIDSSPLQQAQQAAATATALAEALKLPAEAAGNDLITPTALSSPCPERNEPLTMPAESLDATPQRPLSSSVDEPRTESILIPPSAEALPVVDANASDLPVATVDNLESLNAGDGDSSNPAEVIDAPSTIAENVPQTVDRVPAEKQESCLSEPVTEAPISNESDFEKLSEVKIDETIAPPSDESTFEKVESAEPSSESPIRTNDANGVEAMEEKASEIIVECVVTEEPITCEKEEVTEQMEFVEQVIEPDDAMEEEVESVEEAVIEPPDVIIDTIVESEEGPVPISEEILVEAKPAVVIPEDEETTDTVEDVVDIDVDVSRVDTESVEVVPDVEDKLETETVSDIAMPTEEILISEEPKESTDSFVRNETAIDPPIRTVIEPIVENVVDKAVDPVPETIRSEEESMPPTLPESPVPSPRETFDPENVNVAVDSNTVPSQVIDVEPPQTSDADNTEQTDGIALSLAVQQIETAGECFAAGVPVPPAHDASSQMLDDSSSCSINEKDDTCLANQTHFSSARLEHVPSPTNDDLPPAPEDTIQRSVDSSNCPLPPEELSCTFNLSELKSEHPMPDPASPRNPTETLLTPPRSPSPRSNVSVTSELTASTKDSSQTQLYDDQSNREFKMESVSISLNSYNESDIELKERLAESLAETEKQEESSVSCQLSNNATSSTTTVQETHQSTPESEAPVENNVAHDSTTESSADAVKITTPAVPSEVVPATPPSVPAITEDVASVTKAIEEMDISDKAVAAATIECTTNEIIADALYQNNINE